MSNRYLSHFEPDPERMGEFLACLWQGPVPPDLHLERWLYLEGGGIAALWEGGEEAREWMERALGSFGRLDNTVVSDATGGLAACLARDLEGFGAWMRARGAGEEEVARGLDVRRRGLEAASAEEAAEAGREWAAGR